MPGEAFPWNFTPLGFFSWFFSSPVLKKKPDWEEKWAENPFKKLQPPGGIGIIPMDTQAGIKHSQGFFLAFFPPTFFPHLRPGRKIQFYNSSC